jgi:hypothetical protein
MCAQVRRTSGSKRSVSESRQNVQACFTPAANLGDEDLADVRDAELVCRTVSKEKLSAEESSDLEAAALRRLERRKANVSNLQPLVDSGAVPLDRLNASMEQVDSALQDYVLAVSRTALVNDGFVAMMRTEYESLEFGKIALSRGSIERFNGNGSFTRQDFKLILFAYEKHFHKSLPVSAHGDTLVHRALGYDHRDRIDVALFPDAAEGLWLRRYLESNDIPYCAFRSYVPGKATAAHIHIGPPSNRLRSSE